MILNTIFIIAPVLIIIEFFTRHYSQMLYLQHYSKHIEIADYSTVIVKKINYMSLIFSLLNVMISIYVVFIFFDIGYTFKRIFIGYFLTILSTPIAANLHNIFVYLYTINNPSEIVGHVKISLNLFRKISLSLVSSFLVPFIFILLYLPDPIIIGAIIGMLTLIFLTMITTVFLKKNKKLD